MTKEKRLARRKPLTVQVTYRVDGQKREGAYHVESANISKDGILLRTNLPLAIGTAIELKFSLPGREEVLRLSGEVVWSRGVETMADSAFTGKGIHFTHCGDHCRALLEEYMET